MAIPTPLKAGPQMIPRLVVPWISALAEVNCARGTTMGTDAVSVGLKAAIAMASKRTKMYNTLTVNASTDIAQGTNPISMARNTFEPMSRSFFGNRSTSTPISGPHTIGGIVCRSPIAVVLSGDPVIE